MGRMVSESMSLSSSWSQWAASGPALAVRYVRGEPKSKSLTDSSTPTPFSPFTTPTSLQTDRRTTTPKLNKNEMQKDTSRTDNRQPCNTSILKYVILRMYFEFFFPFSFFICFKRPQEGNHYFQTGKCICCLV